MVNLRKTERDFSPTTMYRDYAISPDLFHWESQNTHTARLGDGAALPEPPEQGTQVVLFVRETPEDDIGPAPFLCLGPGELREHRGEQPIAITWRLRRPMPQSLLQAGAVDAA